MGKLRGRGRVKMTDDTRIERLAATFYAFYFTRDGGCLEMDVDNPQLIHWRTQCWKHAQAFYKSNPDDLEDDDAA